MKLSNNIRLAGLYSFLCLTFATPMLAQQKSLDWQGHRGCRGLLPENSIPAFKKALDLGVTTLELDVVISKDKQVVVSHDPFFSSEFCLDTAGKSIDSAQEKQHNLYQYTYEQIKAFDCGSKPHLRFPEQQKMKVYKPLLSEVFTEMEKYRKEKKLPLFSYNIEIKSEPAGDNVYQPGVAEFSQLVYTVIKDHIFTERIILQSFDFRVLRYWKEHYPDFHLAALVENTRSVEKNLADLGFTPQIYSPYYELLTHRVVEKIHQSGMRLIPWTVNTVAEMKKLKAWGVDGIITDYPNRIKELP